MKSHQNQFDSYTLHFSKLFGIDSPVHVRTCRTREDMDFMDLRLPRVDSDTVDRNAGFIDMPDLSYTVPNLDEYIL